MGAGQSMYQSLSNYVLTSVGKSRPYEMKVDIQRMAGKMDKNFDFPPESEHDHKEVLGADELRELMASACVSVAHVDASDLLPTSIRTVPLASKAHALTQSLQTHRVCVIKATPALMQAKQRCYDAWLDFCDHGESEMVRLASQRGELAERTNGYWRLHFPNHFNARDVEFRDVFRMTSSCPPEMFPVGPLRAAAIDLQMQLEALARAALQAIAIGLDHPADALTKLLDVDRDHADATTHATVVPKNDRRTSMCLFRYQGPGNENDTTQRCMVHQDEGLLTLLPKATVPGIEALHPLLDKFVPLEEAIADDELLLYTGEMLSYMTKGNIEPLVHRVVRQPGMQRISSPLEVRSAAAYLNGDDVMLTPLDHLVPVQDEPQGGEPMEYEPITVARFWIRHSWRETQKRVKRLDHIHDTEGVAALHDTAAPAN